jgi:hypothetical protein
MAPNLVRYPKSFGCPWNQNAADGLLLLRHLTLLTRRDVVYFRSGAHSIYDHPELEDFRAPLSEMADQLLCDVTKSAASA